MTHASPETNEFPYPTENAADDAYPPAAQATVTRFDVVQQPALVAMRRAVQAAYAELRATEGNGLVRGFESYETVAARGVAVAALRAAWKRLADDYEAAVVVALAGLSGGRVAL